MRSLVLFVALVGCGACGIVLAGGEIHGTVETTRGEVLTGPIRWDKNENFWGDILDAAKTDPVDRQDPDDGFKLNLFGWEVINSNSSHRFYRQFSIPFGHLSSIESHGSNGAILHLKNGESIVVEGSTADLGRGLELVIQDARRGSVELPWRRIAGIDFSGSPGKGRDGQRLYGRVVTRSGELTGFIIWDRDESLREDVLDGEENGRDHEIPFADIAAIEPLGSHGARVVLESGQELELRGTNDVNDDNRGTLVTVKGTGTIEVPWHELEKVVFETAPPSPKYDEFDGGRRLTGSLRTATGEVYSGTITWDMDESYSWESLDGDADELEYSVWFENIVSVKPVNSRSAEVRLRNDEVLVLSGSNDVDSDNRGIMVTTRDGTEVVVGWEDVAIVEFESGRDDAVKSSQR